MAAGKVKDKDRIDCFAFYSGSTVCTAQCPINDKCKAVMVSHGLQYMGTLVDLLVMDLDALPQNIKLKDTDQVRVLALMLQDPTKYVLTKEEEDLLGMVKGSSMKHVSVDDI